jgi:L-alanine-DL-glutamate epimerase-like enolase superfamily enzyme
MGSRRFADARLTRVVMAKTDPTWRFALGARPDSTGLLLELTDDEGRTGVGWASEIPHLGHHIEVMEAVARAHLPRILAADPADHHALVGNPWHPTLAAPVRSMVDQAWWDLLGKTVGTPVYRLLGGPAPKALRVNRILSLKSPADMAKVAAGLADEGYDHFKIKIENAPPALDVARVREIREAVGPDAVLTVDANQSYDRKGAVAFGAAVARYDVAVFEQPVPQHDVTGLRYVTEHSELTIEADEAADSLLAIRDLLREQAADAVSLKLSKLGGIDALVLAANLCHAHGIGYRIGAHVGSRIMNAAALHAAAALPGGEPAGEVGEFARLTGDVATGLEVDSGSVVASDDPGLGVRVPLPNGVHTATPSPAVPARPTGR